MRRRRPWIHGVRLGQFFATLSEVALCGWALALSRKRCLAADSSWAWTFAALAGPSTATQAARHSQEIDELGAEIRELRLHISNVEPQIAMEVRQKRRARADLVHARREAESCERSIAAHVRERTHWEHQKESAATTALRLEARADELVEESSAAQRQLRLEDEVKQLSEERSVLWQEAQVLSVMSRRQEQQVRSLSCATAKRSAELGLVEPNVLCALAKVSQDIEDIEAGEARVEMEASVLRGEATAMRDEVKVAEKQCVIEAESLKQLQVVVQGERAENVSLVDKREMAGRSQNCMSEEAAMLSEEHLLHRQKLHEWVVAAEQVDQARRLGLHELKAAEQWAADVEVAESQASAHLEGHVAELQEHVLMERSWLGEQKTLHALRELELTRLLSSTGQIQDKIGQSKAANAAIRRLKDDAVLEDRTQQAGLLHVKRECTALELSQEDSLSKMQALEEQLREEMLAAGNHQRHADELVAHGEVAAEEVGSAMRHSRETLKSTATGTSVLLERERCLGLRVAAREEQQACLTWDITKATQELAQVRDSTTGVLSELARLRREGAQIKRFLAAE